MIVISPKRATVSDVTIGGHLAAIGTAQGWRRHAFDEMIALLAAEPDVSHELAPLYKEMVIGEVEAHDRCVGLQAFRSRVTRDSAR